MDIRESRPEFIGRPPHQEEYIDLESGGKLMELSYIPDGGEEGADRFFIYIQNNGEEKVPGATTALLKRAIEKMQTRVNELGRPVVFVLDPVVPAIRLWSLTPEVTQIVGGWDEVQRDTNGRLMFLRKTFYPNS
jgi:hypothetical protein